MYGAITTNESSWTPIWYYCSVTKEVYRWRQRTYGSHNPQQGVQRAVLHTAELFKLFIGEEVERRVATYNRIELQIGDNLRALGNGVGIGMRRDRAGQWDGHRPREPVVHVGEELAEELCDDFMRHREPSEPPMNRRKCRACAMAGGVSIQRCPADNRSAICRLEVQVAVRTSLPGTRAFQGVV